MLAILLQNRAGQFEGFESIQLALFQKNAKVLQDWRQTAGLRRKLLELFNRCRGTENSSWRVCSDFRSFGEVARHHKLVEALNNHLIGAREAVSDRHAVGQVDIAELLHDIVDNLVFINRHTQNLAFLVDSDDAAGGLEISGHENRVGTHTIHKDAGTGFKVVEMDKAVLGYEINDIVLLADPHCDWEIVDGLWREENVDCAFWEHWVGINMIDFNYMQLNNISTVKMHTWTEPLLR